jgi:hypothetical protein
VDSAQNEIKKIDQEKEKQQSSVVDQQLLERLNNGQQSVLEPEGSETASEEHNG